MAGTLVGFVLDRPGHAPRPRPWPPRARDAGPALRREGAAGARVGAYESVNEQLHDVGETVTTSLLPSVVAAAERAAEAIGDAVDAGRPHVQEALTPPGPHRVRRGRRRLPPAGGQRPPRRRPGRVGRRGGRGPARRSTRPAKRVALVTAKAA